MKPIVILVAALLVTGCATATRASGPATGALASRSATVGHLRVLVRSGEQGQNPAIAGASITVQETGQRAETDADGYSPVWQLPATEQHPTLPDRQVGYYTVVVTKDGFKKHIHHTYVIGGLDAAEPTELTVFLTRGDGEETVTDSPVGGRTSPQTPGK